MKEQAEQQPQQKYQKPALCMNVCVSVGLQPVSSRCEERTSLK